MSDGRGPTVTVLGSAEAAVPQLLAELHRAVAGAPPPLVGFATGSTFAPFLRALAVELASGRLAAGHVLGHAPRRDEGFGPERKGGMVHELFTACPPLRELHARGAFVPVPPAADEAAIAAHEARLRAMGGVALQFVGLGRNGHVAFHEPGVPFEVGFHVATLSATTRTTPVRASLRASRRRGRSRVSRDDPRRFPRGALRVRRPKAPAVRSMLLGPVGPACPASALRAHPRVRVLLDRDAASLLPEGVAMKPIVRAALLSLGACAARPAPAPTAPDVDALLQSLSIEQKAGQLFVVWCLSRPAGGNHEQLLERVRDAGLGGVILSLGTAGDAAALVPRLQAAAKVPLLLAGDFEGGVWFRLQGATELGNQMLVGATGSAALAEAMGRATAQEAKALGFHWVFAPVLDVNSNPDNPIINVRSFGEDPELVARLGAAFARGVRSQGLLACGKHFPGHGDVNSDSHLALPTVPGDRARLRRVELRPFAVAAQEGLESVMTGHLAVPGLGEDPDVPATLSSRVLGGVLRGELGFRGLVVTDALDMGVRGALPPGEVAVRALLAGADVLLMPPDPLAARGAVVDAVRSGRVPVARLDDAVRRILEAKAKVGLLSGQGRVAPDWQSQLCTPAAEQAADAIAAAGVTLLRCRDGVLPLRPGQRGALLVVLADKDEGQAVGFASHLAGIVGAGDVVRLSGTSDADAVAAGALRVAAARTVVLALDVRVRENRGSLGLPARLQPVLEALADEQCVVAVSFGDPYVGRVLPAADAHVCAFVATARTERRVASALRGDVPFVGRLPVGIPGVARVGDGLTQLPGVDVRRGEPEEQGLAADLPRQVHELLAAALADRAFPGAVCAIARHGVQVAAVAVGRESQAEDAPAVRVGTRYDLASLTKVCATTPAVLRLAAKGTLSLDDPVVRWLPGFGGGDRATVTVRDLLAHRSGLPAWAPFHRTLDGRDAIVAAATSTALASAPRTEVRYSDVGFVLLGAIVEAASGESLASFAAREVFAPLGMTHAAFAPLDAPATDAAPTELDPARGGVLRGRVHDENAHAMGGVAGHAGLFATADDVLRLGVGFLAGGRGVLPPELVAECLRTDPSGVGAGLGMRLLEPGGFGGSEVPRGAFGHTGFTGTSLWCDPVHDLCVVLLTNRVHPSRDNGKIAAVRRALHELVLAALR